MARELKIATIKEAQARINSKQFAEWQAYFSLRPHSESRADLRACVLASIIAATVGCDLDAVQMMKALSCEEVEEETPQERAIKLQAKLMAAFGQ